MKKKIIIASIIIIILVTGGIYYFTQNLGAEEVDKYTVKKENIKEFIEEDGIVRSRLEKMLYSKTNGEVEKINVDIGDNVLEGTTIIKFDDEEILLQIKSMEAKLDSLIATYKEAISPTDASVINKAQANVNTVKIRLKEARDNLEKTKKLYEEGAISKEKYQEVLNGVKLLEEELKIANSNLSSALKGVSSNVKKQYKSQIDELEYQIQKLRKIRDNYTIKSPINGTVLDKKVEEGSVVQAGTPLMEMGSKDNLYLQLDILVSEISEIDLGDKVIISSEDLNIKEIQGEVTKIYPKAISKLSDLGIEQKRVKIEVDFTETDEDLKIGYELKGNIITKEKKNALVIPESSVIELEDGKYLYIIEEGKAKLTKIKIGIEENDKIEVLSGIKEEDIIISDPDNIEEGTEVK